MGRPTTLRSIAGGCAIAAALLVGATRARADAGVQGTVVWEKRAQGGPPGVTEHALAYDAVRGNVVLFGGATVDGAQNATWLWDGAAWKDAAPAVSPPPRSGHAMTFDAARGRVVVFGGEPCSGCAPLADTWEWDGASWSPGPVGPPARSHAALVFDPARGKSVLFGGAGAADTDAGTPPPVMADTWELDANGWTAAAPAIAAPPRAAAAATYDTKLRGVVVYGGYARLLPPRLAIVYDDAWAYDGATWRQVSTGTPPTQRFAAALAHDAARRRSVLVGGVQYAGAGPFGETWEWDGVAWTQRGPADRYPHRYYTGAATFDSARRRVVYATWSGSDVELWEYYAFGDACDADARCDTGHCSGGVCCTQACGVCSDCDFTGLACATVERRDDPDSCTGDSTCDALGRCGKKLGRPCARPEECASGVCTAGACCLVDACGAFACGADGLCRTACSGPGDCAPGATCASGVCQPTAGTCEGDVAVAPSGVRTACAPYACGPAGCSTACTTSEDCAAGHLCAQGRRCVAAPPLVFPGCATTGSDDGKLAGVVAVVAAVVIRSRRRRARRAG